jgi:hypothetical protein
MKKWKGIAICLALILSGGTAFVPATGVAAADILSRACQKDKDSTVCKSQKDKAPDMIKIVINTLFVVLGMVAVVMIVVGGIRYASSAGDAGSLKSAKDTIMYAVVGLVVAIMSYTIVNFVVNWFKI